MKTHHAEPRERDYAYAASFYAFSFWIGIGVWALFDFARNINFNHLKKIATYTIGGSGLILLAQYISRIHPSKLCMVKYPNLSKKN
ncbi:hypothetical protein N9K77_01590 [bacterium]|nr:hypothetical protein [bacterium]